MNMENEMAMHNNDRERLTQKLSLALRGGRIKEKMPNSAKPLTDHELSRDMERLAEFTKSNIFKKLNNIK